MILTLMIVNANLIIPDIATMSTLPLSANRTSWITHTDAIYQEVDDCRKL